MKLILCGLLDFAKTAVVSLKWSLKMQVCSIYGEFNFSFRTWPLGFSPYMTEGYQNPCAFTALCA